MIEDTKTLAESLNLTDLISGLVGDLRSLRAGKISVREAHARAELARQILRGVHYVVVAQRFIESQALPAPGSAPEGKPPRRRSRTIDQ
jgi:hypothetical protein